MNFKELGNKIASARWTPLVPMIMGLFLLVYLLTLTEPGFHFSCDGALKEYNLWLWSQSNSISNELTLPNMPDWAREIWSAGYFPIRPPFEHERHIVFPPFFQIFSYPFHGMFGYYGLFILPALSVIGLWILTWRFWMREQMDGLPALVGMSLLALSPLTFYGAMYWEHAPAIFLFMIGFVTVIRGVNRDEQDSENVSWSWRDIIGGGVMVLSQAMRPELVVGTAIVVGLGVIRSRGRKGFLFGGALAGAFWVSINLMSTGHVFGIHHAQERYLSDGFDIDRILEYIALNGLDFALMTPAIALAILVSAGAFRKNPLARIERGALLGTFVVSFLLLIFILPNLGDFQLYRRFFLIIIPVGALLGARLAQWRSWMGWAILGVHLASTPGLLFMTSDYAWFYQERIKPLYERIEANPPKAFISVSNDGVLDFSPMMKEIPFFQLKSEDEVLDLIEKMSPHVAPEEIAFVFLQHALDPMRPKRTITLRDGRTFALQKFNNGRSIFYLFRLVPLNPAE